MTTDSHDPAPFSRAFMDDFDRGLQESARPVDEDAGEGAIGEQVAQPTTGPRQELPVPQS